MSVPFKVVAKTNPQKPQEPKKFYAMALSSGEITVRELATQISKRSTLSVVDVVAVLESLIEVIPERIAEGNIVRLGDFGSFSMAISSSPSEHEEDVTASNILSNSLNFRPGKELLKSLSNIKFKKV